MTKTDTLRARFEEWFTRKYGFAPTAVDDPSWEAFQAAQPTSTEIEELARRISTASEFRGVPGIRQKDVAAVLREYLGGRG